MKLGLLQQIATIMYFLWYPDGAREMIPKNWRCPRPERTTSCAETMSKGLIHGAGPIWVMVISRNLLLKFWNLYIYHRGITVSWHPPQGLVWIGAEVPDARPWAQDVPSASHPAPSGRVPQARSELSRRHLGRKRRISRRESGRGDGVPIGNSLELLEEAFFWPIQRLNSGQTLEWI